MCLETGSTGQRCFCADGALSYVDWTLFLLLLSKFDCYDQVALGSTSDNLLHTGLAFAAKVVWFECVVCV